MFCLWYIFSFLFFLTNSGIPISTCSWMSLRHCLFPRAEVQERTNRSGVVPFTRRDRDGVLQYTGTPQWHVLPFPDWAIGEALTQPRLPRTEWTSSVPEWHAQLRKDALPKGPQLKGHLRKPANQPKTSRDTQLRSPCPTLGESISNSF